MAEGYPYEPPSFRARCAKVVDGDTYDLEVDVGFHVVVRSRFRLRGFDTAELNSVDAELRTLAVNAKLTASFKLRVGVKEEWPLRVRTYKNSDHFGRWLCDVYYMEAGEERNLGEELEKAGLAKRMGT